MCEILFRGKRLCDGKWEEGNLCVDDKGEKHEILLRHLNYRISWEVDPGTVGQYTRIRDEHLKRIFEGDICRAQNLLHNEREELYTVEWYENGFFLVDDTGTPWHPQHLDCIESIGNIHDNPELLGGGAT